MKILNLGCGLKTSKHPNIINIDWSFYLRAKKSIILKYAAPLFMNKGRLERFKKVPDNILLHDLSKGIPSEDNSVDAVYHSHMLEHLDMRVAEVFLSEVLRVLKPGGIHRIVVPDLEVLCNNYLEHIKLSEISDEEAQKHDYYVGQLIEQSVRKESYSTSQQAGIRRVLENLVLGDARKRGETHQWMYDRVNLKSKLINSGYTEIYIQKYNTSLIESWNDYGLDLDEGGNQYKPDSLYIESVK